MPISTRRAFLRAAAVGSGLLAMAMLNAASPDEPNGPPLPPLALAPQRLVVDGVSWNYNRVGNGEALVLVHGFGASKESWSLLIPYLADHFDVIAVGLPGFGESDKPFDLGYGARQQAERLYRFAQELGLEKWHVAGNSMGGSVAGELAAAHPDSIRSLWLIGPAGVQAAQRSEFDAYMESGGDNIMIPDTVEAFDRLMDWLYHEQPQIPEAIKAQIVAGLRQNAEPAARAHADLIANWPALEETLDGFARPTLITWGEQDRFVHVSGAAALAERIPHATIDLVPECGHVPMLESPARCAARFKEFVAEL